VLHSSRRNALTADGRRLDQKSIKRKERKEHEEERKTAGFQSSHPFFSLRAFAFSCCSSALIGVYLRPALVVVIFEIGFTYSVPLNPSKAT
jgi:hypothetical protein